MMKLMKRNSKIADTISIFTNPPIITIPLFLIICIVLLACNGTHLQVDSAFNWNQFIITELISLIFASVLPMAIYPCIGQGNWTQTKTFQIGRSFYSSYCRGSVLSNWFFNCIDTWSFQFFNCLNPLLYCKHFIVMLITTKWKISIHTTGLSGPVAALIMLLDQSEQFLAYLSITHMEQIHT